MVMHFSVLNITTSSSNVNLGRKAHNWDKMHHPEHSVVISMPQHMQIHFLFLSL